MKLFDIVPENFFTLMTSKYKRMYLDCLTIIYESYKSEFSFGIEKGIIIDKIEAYFDAHKDEEFALDDSGMEIFTDSKSKANAVVRKLKNCGWIEEEQGKNLSFRINMFDYAVTIMDSFVSIVKNQEMEYQSVISQIYNTLLNNEALAKPYEYVLKNVSEDTNKLIDGLKRLNTNIKKYIDRLTADKSASEIIQGFFDYHTDISKSYHRIKTSDHISKFRASIIQQLKYIKNDKVLFDKAVLGYIEVEEQLDREVAEDEVKGLIQSVITSFQNYDYIIDEIDKKHRKYQQSAIERAKFLLASGTNVKGKIESILKYLAVKFNKENECTLGEDEDFLTSIFNIFPQNFIDGESLYTQVTRRKLTSQAELGQFGVIADEDRQKYQDFLISKAKNSFTRKNIEKFVLELLKNHPSLLASTLPLKIRKDMIRLIFISLYGDTTKYRIIYKDNLININGFLFKDFEITGR